jgi:hypothetical protein
MTRSFDDVDFHLHERVLKFTPRVLFPPPTVDECKKIKSMALWHRLKLHPYDKMRLALKVGFWEWIKTNHAQSKYNINTLFDAACMSGEMDVV